MKTKHFNQRQQQRQISSTSIDLLLFYGKENYQKDGAIRIFLPSVGIRRIVKDINVALKDDDSLNWFRARVGISSGSLEKLHSELTGILKNIGKLKRLFIVESDGRLITTGYQTQHIFR